MSTIGPDDIKAFAEKSEPDIKAATEYARRAKKGLPSDRWATGEDGAEAVARGIVALLQVNAMLTQATAALWAEKVEAGVSAMRLHRDDAKHAERDGDAPSAF